MHGTNKEHEGSGWIEGIDRRLHVLATHASMSADQGIPCAQD
jgi:hypothetical protein